MSARDELAAIEARLAAEEANYGDGHEWEQSFVDRHALIAMVRHRRITTERELAELPANSVATRNQVPYTKDVDGKWYLASKHGRWAYEPYSLLLNDNCFLVYNPQEEEA